MKVKSESEVAQSCPTLSDPTDCSLPGSSIHGIFQARVLEWGASAFSGKLVLRAINSQACLPLGHYAVINKYKRKNSQRGSLRVDITLQLQAWACAWTENPLKSPGPLRPWQAPPTPRRNRKGASGAGRASGDGAGPALVGRLQPEVGRFGVQRRRPVTGEKEAYEKVASPSLGSRGPSEKSSAPTLRPAPSPRLSPLDFATAMWEANPEMFHKAEEFLSKTTDSEVDEMDTSDTQWGWFYLAECGKWHMFQPDTNIQCSVSSEDIEKSFKANPCGSISFTTSKFSYKIDFAEMKQMNLTTGKQRLIKRAPFSISAFSYICENEAIPMPPHWENVNTELPYQLIPLHNQTHEYNEVASLFGKTMDRNRIKRIQRIQNLDLWEFFCRKKAQLKKKRGVPQINEQMLFHGTSSEFVEAICIHNFDWRINGIHGALFGKGTYFARDAAYSSRFCKDDVKHGNTFQIHGVSLPQRHLFRTHKSMFLARVLIGDYINGDSKYMRPPSKDGSYVNLYDSCVDDTWNPRVFVVFDANQIYPEYLIDFH
uniref:Poly [ADP-ribose] polymerase n=1 Tax=Bos indicus x Bos taurus TaxID=30522 RepID=A0A4W2GKI1_BOBOX